jgi:Protein of unknown function (DUF3987)
MYDNTESPVTEELHFDELEAAYADLMEITPTTIAAKLGSTTGISTDTQKLDIPTDDELNAAILEHVKSNEGLNTLHKATFSDKTEQFWLGSGRLFKSSTRIHENVWNGTLGQALTAAALLTTCTRRDWVIRSEFKNVSHPVPGLFCFLSGKTGDAKSPVIGSVNLINKALALLDEDREILRMRLYSQLVIDAKNEDESNKGHTYVNVAMKGTKISVISNNITTAKLMKKLYAQHYYRVQASKLGEPYATALHARCTLLFGTEGGAMLQRITGTGTFGGDDSPIYNAIWSGEPITHERSTDDVSLTINDPRLGILWGIQPHYLLKMREAEAGPDGENNGFGVRPTVVNMHNTEKSAFFVEGVDHTGPDVQKMHTIADQVETRIQLDKIMEGFALSTYDYIVFSPEAAVALVKGMNTLLKDAEPYITGDMVNYLPKCRTNIHKSAWGFQMLEFFDRELPDVSAPLDPIIGVRAVEQAIEHMRMVTNAEIYHHAVIQSRKVLAVQQSEIMLPAHVKQSKYVSILTNPALLDAWLSEFVSKSDAKQALRTTRKKIKDAGLDHNAIIDTAWSRLHS